MRRPRPERDDARLLSVLLRHEVRFVVTGSTAARAHGLELAPGDLDVAPETSAINLARLAAALRELGARPKHVPGWAAGPTREACEAWTPEPPTVERLDHRFVTPHGELDVVPAASGTYEALAPRAVEREIDGVRVPVAAATDVIAGWRRWDRPRDQERIAALARLQGG